MTIFETPDPISVSLDFGVGDIRLVAGDLGKTVVDVKPTDPAKKGDVDAAKQTQVEYASGALLVRSPKNFGAAGPLVVVANRSTSRSSYLRAHACEHGRGSSGGTQCGSPRRSSTSRPAWETSEWTRPVR